MNIHTYASNELLSLLHESFRKSDDLLEKLKKELGVILTKRDITAMQGNIFFIMDAKLKLIVEIDRMNKYGVSQSDMYQLLSYAKIYEAAAKDKTVSLMLIYPAADMFTESLLSHKE